MIVTGWLKRSRTSVGGRSTLDCVTGSDSTSVTCASAVPGTISAPAAAAATTSARLTARRRARSVRRSGAASRSAKSKHGEQHEREREPGAPYDLTRPQRLAQREQREHDEHPADRVVEERRPGVEPRVRLVDEERAARTTKSANAGTSDQSGLLSFPRTTASSTAPATSAACAHTRVREEVHRRERREDRDQPEPDARRDDDGREEIGAPRAAAEDLGADDRLRDEQQADEERDRRGEPVCSLRLAGPRAPPPRGPRRGPARSQNVNDEPDEHDEQRRLEEIVVDALARRGREARSGRAGRPPTRSRRRWSAGRGAGSRAFARAPYGPLPRFLSRDAGRDIRNSPVPPVPQVLRVW